MLKYLPHKRHFCPGQLIIYDIQVAKRDMFAAVQASVAFNQTFDNIDTGITQPRTEQRLANPKVTTAEVGDRFYTVLVDQVAYEHDIGLREMGLR